MTHQKFILPYSLIRRNIATLKRPPQREMFLLCLLMIPSTFIFLLNQIGFTIDCFFFPSSEEISAQKWPHIYFWHSNRTKGVFFLVDLLPCCASMQQLPWTPALGSTAELSPRLPRSSPTQGSALGAAGPAGNTSTED